MDDGLRKEVWREQLMGGEGEVTGRRRVGRMDGLRRRREGLVKMMREEEGKEEGCYDDGGGRVSCF